MTGIEQFKLAEVTIGVFASPETCAALYDDVMTLLEAKYGQASWEVASLEDVTDDAEHREALERLRQEAEVAARFR